MHAPLIRHEYPEEATGTMLTLTLGVARLSSMTTFKNF